jgi:hypothetical protein
MGACVYWTVSSGLGLFSCCSETNTSHRLELTAANKVIRRCVPFVIHVFDQRQ